MFHVYALWNARCQKMYIGHTINLDIRLARHNKLLPNKARSYTSKNKGPWIVIHKEEFSTRDKAIRREKELKSFKGREFIRKLISHYIESLVLP